MTLLELANCNDLRMRIRSELLSCLEVQHWLNVNLGHPQYSEDPINTDAVITACIHLSDLQSASLDATVRFVVVVLNNEDRHEKFLTEYFGKSPEIDARGDCTFYAWSLYISEWPFITFDLISECLRQDLESDKRSLRINPQPYLQLHVPGLEYSKLLHLCQLDLLSIDALNTGDISLRNFLLDSALRPAIQQIDLPSDGHGVQ